METGKHDIFIKSAHTQKLHLGNKPAASYSMLAKSSSEGTSCCATRVLCPVRNTLLMEQLCSQLTLPRFITASLHHNHRLPFSHPSSAIGQRHGGTMSTTACLTVKPIHWWRVFMNRPWIRPGGQQEQPPMSGTVAHKSKQLTSYA
jgi:hypothetical protein